MEIAELGAGGGQGDLDTHNELDVGDAAVVGQLIALCASKLQSQPQLLASVMELLTGFISKQISSVSLDDSGFIEDCARAVDEADFVNVDELPLERLVPALAKLVTKAKQKKSYPSPNSPKISSKRADGLAKQITFPYSRHSSYGELCDLVDAFKPKDIHPCTVDDAHWTTDQSMSFLFGHIYTSGPQFSHDQMMLKKRGVSRPSMKITPRALSPAGSDHAPQDLSQNTQRRREDKRRIARRMNEATGHGSGDVPMQDAGRGDLWQPQEQADHYAPARRRRQRKESKLPSPDAAVLDALRRGSLPFDSHSSAALLTRLPPKRLSEKMDMVEWPEQGVQRFKRRRSSDDEPRDGRLSPPPFEETLSLPTDAHAAALLGAAEGRRLFIGNLPARTSSTDLKTFCAGYEIENVYVPQQSAKHVSGGYGFAEFTTPAETRRAMSGLRGRLFRDRGVRIELARDAGSSPLEESAPVMKYENEQPTAEEARMALRYEAYEAVQNDDNIHWSRLGLVSTGGGHQIKEEEL